MIAEDKPTIAERYSRAIESSDLRVRETRGDVDVLIAAGWSEGLGTLLYRLMVEFDGVRADVRRGPLNQTERLLILSQLKTLPAAREALGHFAIQQATRQRFMQPDTVVLKLVGKVLDVFLDPLCHHCEGRGFTGGSHRGEKRVLCQPCGGSGHRRHRIGRTDQEHAFTASLLTDMDCKLAEVSAAMKRMMRQA